MIGQWLLLDSRPRHAAVHRLHRRDREACELAHRDRVPAKASDRRAAAQSNPLHISLFATTGAVRAPLEFSLLLSSALDVFEARAPHITVDQDFGLLQAVDERLAMYGWLTNTGVKLVVVVDMDGRADDAPGAARGRGAAAAAAAKIEAKGGLRDADLKPVRRAGGDARRGVAPGLALSCTPGVPRPADGVHCAAAQSLLQPGRPHAARRGGREPRRLDADHQPPLRPRGAAYRRGLGAGRDEHLRARGMETEREMAGASADWWLGVLRDHASWALAEIGSWYQRRRSAGH